MQEQKTSTPLVHGHDYQPVKTCPKCTSVFITDNECEGCGYQLDYSPIGDAFGEKSFYSMKELYWDQQSRLVKNWPELERKKSAKAQKYKRDLLHRFDTLLEFLLSESEDDRSFYWLEFQALCRELYEYSVSSEELSQKLNDHSFHGYAPLIHEYLSDAGTEFIEEDKTLWESFLNYKIAGLLGVKFLLMTLIGGAAISTASLLVYQYFFLFS